MIGILIVDDHSVVVEGLTMLLSSYDDLDVIGSAPGGAQALERFEALRPEVVLMDLQMPGVDGVEATRRIMAAHPAARVIALTGFVEKHLVSEALTAGACGYLLKNVGGDELARTIRSVSAGQSVLSSEAMAQFRGGPGRPANDRGLTPRELDVLEHIVRGLSNKQIADELGITLGTVRIHVSNILAKLHVANRTAAAYLAIYSELVPDPDRR